MTDRAGRRRRVPWPRPTRPTPIRRRRARRHHPERPLRRRQDGRREAVRGPRLHRRRQPARASCCRTSPSSSSTDRERFAQVAIVLDVRSGDATLALGRDARRARGPRHPAAGLLPRGQRRGPHPALLRDAPPPSARRPARHRQRRSPRSAACSIRSAPRRTSSSTRRTCRCASSASGSSPGSARRPSPDQLAIQLISFGFKYGVPLEADLVFDVRFMQNPYYVAGAAPALRPDRAGPRLTSSASRSPSRFLEFLDEFLAFALPAYVGEGKTRLTIAIGCTGGYHRSIAIAEELADLAARAGLRAGRGLPPRARPGVNLPALADARDRRQALAARRVRSGCCSSPSASPTSSARSTRDLEPGGPRSASSSTR